MQQERKAILIAVIAQLTSIKNEIGNGLAADVDAILEEPTISDHPQYEEMDAAQTEFMDFDTHIENAIDSLQAIVDYKPEPEEDDDPCGDCYSDSCEGCEHLDNE